jgi:protein-arginine kinase activator protein McsA
LSIEELQQKLQAALEEEEYELASKIRDEISKRSEN